MAPLSAAVLHVSVASFKLSGHDMGTAKMVASSLKTISIFPITEDCFYEV